MKKMYPLFIFVFALISQAKAQVDPALVSMQLYDGSSYVTYGHRITQVFSELTYEMGVGVFPKTNIAYLNYQQLILLMQDSSKRENRSQETYVQARNYLKEKAAGGRIVLYVERFDLYSTNNKFLFIIIRDKEDKEIYEYNLPARSAQLVTGDIFSNWAVIDIPVALPDEFYVFVNHKLTEYLSDTKFLVQVNAAPIVKTKEEETQNP